MALLSPPVRFRSAKRLLRRVPALVPMALVLSGCTPVGKPGNAHSLPAHSRRTANSNPLSKADTGPLTVVRAHPLYRLAEKACRDKRFGAAAALLARLQATPGFTPAQVRFVRQQRVVCLQDAHLPVAPALLAASLAPPSPSPALSFPRSVGSVSPAQADCGPRALLLVCRHLNVSTSLPSLRQQAGTTVEGTSMAGLAAAAKAVGLKAQGVQVSREALPDADMPAVAWVNNHHFVAVLSTQGSGENGTATIHDPNSANEEIIPQERLLRLCSGYLLLLRR